MTKTGRLWLFAWQICFFVTFLASASREDDFDRIMGEAQDKTDWVDPLDMGIYESSQPAVDLKVVQNMENELNKCNSKLKICQTEKANENNKTETKPKVTESVAPNDLFMKRHVKVLLQKMKLSYDSDVHLSLEIKLTAREVSVLRSFSEDGSSKVQDVDPILSSFIHSVEEFDPSPWSWQEDLNNFLPQLREPLLLAVAAGSLVYLLFVVMRCLPAWKLVIILIVLSVSWHWLRMYKMRWAAKHATLLSSGKVPAECHPQDMSWLQSIQYTARSAISATDRCGEYHEAIMVDPLYEINPLTAAVDLATNLLLHPMSKLGSEVGAMFAGLLSAVPLFWKVPVLLVFVLLLMLVMVMAAGYRVRLPMFLGAIEPARGAGENVAVELQAIKQALQEMKAAQKDPAIEVVKGSVEAIESQLSMKAISSQSSMKAITSQPSMEAITSQSSLAIETITHHSEAQKASLQIQSKSSDILTVGSESESRKITYDEVEDRVFREPSCNTPSRRKLYDDPSFESSQPVNLCKTVTNQHLQINSGVLDLSTPSKKTGVTRENSGEVFTPSKLYGISQENSGEVCTAPKDSVVSRGSVGDELCVTPTKTLVTRNASSPVATEFSWVIDGNGDKANSDEEETRGSGEFLSSVEGIFQRTDL